MVREIPLDEISLSDAVAEMSRGSDLPPFRIVVLRQSTVDLLVPYLVVGARHLGVEVSVVFGNYDAVWNDLNNEKLWSDRVDAVVVAMDADRFSPDLHHRFAELNDDEIDVARDDAVKRARNLVSAIRKRSSAPILWVGFSPFAHRAYGLADTRRGELSQVAQIRKLNSQIDDLIERSGPGWLVYTETVTAMTGHAAMAATSFRHGAAVPYSAAGFRGIANEILKYLRVLLSKTKKVFLVDCDGVLWGGSVGELGAASVDLSPSSAEGAAHLELQRALVALHRRGVLLALVSKNDERNVWEVFDTRKEMILKRSHITAAKINWAAKADNIRTLSEELNLGLDSFVFVDDEPSQTELVKYYLPEVDVLTLTDSLLSHFARLIESAGWFEAPSITSADRARNKSYISNMKREVARKDALDITSFLHDLGMSASIKFDRSINVDRAAQMCQRTNQFNMTTHRYSVADIRTLVASPDATVVTIGLEDKFGDLGDVGLILVKYQGMEAVVDTFLLSCRVFGRHCEDLLLYVAAEEARNRGMKTLVGIYEPTKKNRLLSSFWKDRGFSVEPSNGGSQRAILGLDTGLKAPPLVFASIIYSEERDALEHQA